MVRKFIPLWLGFCTCLPAGLWAEEATKKGLSSIPSDAVAFLYAPTVKSLDSAYQGLLRDLGLQIFLPPPARSITGLIGQNFPMFEGIDEEGTFALVLMPFERPEEFYSKLAFNVPAKDPDAMLKALGGQAGEGELWAVNLMGQPAVALVDGKSLVISSSADVAKAIKQSKAGMGEKLPAAELAAFTDMNVALWINAEQIFKVYGTTIDPLVSMLLMQRQGAASALERSSAGMNKKTRTRPNSCEATSRNGRCSRRVCAAASKSSRLGKQDSWAFPASSKPATARGGWSWPPGSSSSARSWLMQCPTIWWTTISSHSPRL
jgi:hypothetical protein